jgi:hypothetical protein
MSQYNAEGFLSGFSVFQPAIGAPLQFMPALGSKELDELLAIYFAGEGTVRDQITTVSIDFFECAALTGELFKFYPVFDPSLFTQTSSNSPTSSAYESSFNTSPSPVELSPWTPALSDFGTPISTTTSAASFSVLPASQSTAVSSSSSSSASSSTSRPRATDFSHLPGMRIMTRDGRDVTQSASRGCKTKEQRDHAHLMRIIKACDACKARKVRCDPSHKKRAPSGSSSSPQSTSDARVKKREITTKTRDPNYSATPSGLPSGSGLPQASGLPQTRLPRPGTEVLYDSRGCAGSGTISPNEAFFDLDTFLDIESISDSSSPTSDLSHARTNSSSGPVPSQDSNRRSGLPADLGLVSSRSRAQALSSSPPRTNVVWRVPGSLSLTGYEQALGPDRQPDAVPAPGSSQSPVRSMQQSSLGSASARIVSPQEYSSADSTRMSDTAGVDTSMPIAPARLSDGDGTTMAMPGLFVLPETGVLLVMALVWATISSMQAILLDAVSVKQLDEQVPFWSLTKGQLRLDWASENLVCRARNMQEDNRGRKQLRDLGTRIAGLGRHASRTLMAWG